MNEYRWTEKGAECIQLKVIAVKDQYLSSRSSLFDWESWVALPAYTLVFLMVVFPSVAITLSYIKVFLFAAILATVGIAILKTGQTGLHPAVALWTFSLSTLSCLFALEGFFRAAPGAERTGQVYCIWPIIYGLVIAGVRSRRILLGLIRALTVSTIFIGIFSIVYLLIQTNILPENRLFDLISFDSDQQIFGLGEGYIHMQFPGINSLPFLVPFSLAALATCLPRILGVPSLRRIWLWAAVFLSLTTVMLSARRALYLVTLTAPFLTLLFVSFQPMVERRLSREALLRVTVSGVLAAVVSLACLSAVSETTLSGLADRFSVGFDFSPTSEDHGASERREQFHALLAGWMENPILGAGHGSSAFGSIRSPESPWNYELYYLALLYQTGLLGFTAYAAGIFWIYWMGVRVIRAGGYLSALMVACLVGMSSLLVATATNPYLARFDGIWTIFLPLALINFWLLRRARPCGSALA